MPKKSLTKSKTVINLPKEETIKTTKTTPTIMDYLKNEPFVKKVAVVFVALFVLLAFGLYFKDSTTIMVVGTYSGYEENKIGTFIATINVEDPTKDKVTTQLNEGIKLLTTAVTEFGIDEADVKTTNNTVYQTDVEQPTRVGVSTVKKWVGSSSLEIIVRDATKIDEFSTVLNRIANLQVYGPTFSVDQINLDETRMLASAIDDAKEKARFIAKNNKRRLGRILSIYELESSNYNPYPQVLSIKSEDSVEFSPGTTQVSKNVQVKFSLF